MLNHIRLPLVWIQLLPALSAHFFQIKLPENGPELQNLVIVGVDRVLGLEKDLLMLLLVLELEVFRTGRYPAIRLIQRSAHNRVQVTTCAHWVRVASRQPVVAGADVVLGSEL